jgi:hypothetical protein
LLRLVGGIVAGKLEGGTLRQSLAPLIDDGSIPEVSETIREHGIPNLMVVYVPGVDIYAHGSPNPLPSQTEYLESNIDRDVGKVLDEYSKRGALSDTYVIFTADHGHTPVLNDREHDLGIRDGNRLLELLENIGLRVREPGLQLPADKQDYQAVIADEGFTAYPYLADRSTCPKKGEPCDWGKLPRFRHDILPVLRALYRANRREIEWRDSPSFRRQPSPWQKSLQKSELLQQTFANQNCQQNTSSVHAVEVTTFATLRKASGRR